MRIYEQTGDETGAYEQLRDQINVFDYLKEIFDT